MPDSPSQASSRMAGMVVGVDVGGTFTDLVAVDASGAVRLAKVPTTLDNQANGVLNALQMARCAAKDLGLIVHGTTTTTNAVLERKLARTGLITTAGFRDILELGRRTRPQAYGMHGEFTPIIPRNLRLEVAERMDCDGNVVVPLDEVAVQKTAQSLLDEGCEAVVVHFLHAYANPTHELRAKDILDSVWPNTHITLGHTLLSESREYERGVTAAVNASVQPLLDRYVQQLLRDLAAQGYAGELLVMNGNGGMVTAQHVAKEAVKTVMSGPASGVMAAAFTGARAGYENLITYDMGGTSTDVALIRDAQPSVSNEIELEYAMPIHVPMVDVRTVGAGGGSIARITAGGLLDIGPDSAGATPGPICYGQGGTDPTISDANMLLGRLDPSGLSHIQNVVAETDVQSIFSQKLGKPLDCDAIQAAAAVIRVANDKMAGAIRMVSLSLGADPRDFSLFAFGGAGPLHACALARELSIPRVLVPARPGMTNALGCVVADLRHDYVRTINIRLDALAPHQLETVFNQQIAHGETRLSLTQTPIQSIQHIYSLDMQFVGQTHLLRVPLTDTKIDKDTLQTLFEDAYFDRFHVTLDNITAAIVNVNCSVLGRRAAIDLSQLIEPAARKSTLEDAKIAVRAVYVASQWHQTPIYQRELLPETFDLKGPAIVQQLDTTLLIEPSDRANADADGNIIVHIGDAL